MEAHDDVDYYDDSGNYDARRNDELYQEYEFDYDEDKETLSELFEYCLSPTVHDVAVSMLPLLMASLLFKILGQSRFTPCNVFHVISATIGICVVQRYVPECLPLLATLFAASCAFLHLPRSYSGAWLALLPSLSTLLYCELFLHPTQWHKMRGVVMVAAMKTISVAIDATETEYRPSFYEYAGYFFCPATCIFGPWIALKDYAALHRRNHRGFSWLLALVGYLLLAFVFLTLSNCWTQWLVPDDAGKWLVAYRDALSFRASHYFVSFSASSALLLAGFPVSSVVITRPLDVEMPYSLVQVVVSWNVPVHCWLKTYIFRPSRRHLGTLGAVVMTYLASSLLHGLNFQLAAVLMSLGFYTYVEFQLRAVLAKAFDACVASRRCAAEKCGHARTSRGSVWVIATNMAFSALSVFHLAYLGVMFDTGELQETGYSYAHTVEKWSRLGFASHWVALATYCAYFLIR